MNQSISFQQLPQVVSQLLKASRFADAARVINAFLERGAVSFVVVHDFISQAQAAGAEAEVKPILASLQAAKPAELNTWKITANSSMNGHDWQAALAAIDRIEALDARTDETLAMRAKALEMLMRPDQALSLLEGRNAADTSVQLRFHCTRANALVQLKQRDAAVQELEKATPLAGRNVDSVSAWKLLGRLYDQAGRHEEAFQAWQKGNAIARQLYTAGLEVNPFGLRVRTVRSVFQPDWVASWSDAGEARQSPVFLVGFPRSGTTLLEQVLDAHPGIQTLDEKPAVERLWNALGATADMSALTAGGARPGPEQLFAHAISQLATFSVAQFDALRSAYYQAVAAYLDWHPDKVLVDKLPLNLVSVGVLARVFPDARFIVALRHPCDVILSNFMQDFEMNPGMQFMTSLESAGQLYSDAMALLSQCEAHLSLGNRLHYVRYEDVVDDLEGQAGSLLSFLDLDWDPAVTRFYEHARDRGNLGTPSYQGVTQQVYRTAVGRWHHYQTHFEHVLPLLAPACEQFQYNLES